MKVLRKAFSRPLDPVITEFVNSIDADAHLATADIKGSMGHVKMLVEVGLLTGEQGDKLLQGLTSLKEQAEAGELKLEAEYEDVHMNVEHKLGELIGTVAQSLHTARSRNDQVALDFRLYVIEQIETISNSLEKLIVELATKGQEFSDVVMPGYTHLQRAQPVAFAHVMHAFIEMFTRDLDRFKDAKKRVAISPLGAGALAGSSLPISPAFSSDALGLSGTFANSMDAVSDRDFAAEFVFDCSLTAVHLSQIAETFIIWSTTEFNFVQFSDAVTTTSSLMPQKKNPDPVELVRAKVGSISGDLVNLIVTLKGLPIGYNRDLQETKPPVINSATTLEQCLRALTVVVKEMSVNQDKTNAAASDPELMATDLVEYLVNKSVPFRSAHEIVASIVACAREESILLTSLPLETYREFCDQFDQDLFDIFDPNQSANAKTSPGGAACKNAQAALKKALSAIQNK